MVEFTFWTKSAIILENPLPVQNFIRVFDRMNASHLTNFDCLHPDLEFRDLDRLEVMCSDIDRVRVSCK